LNGEFWSDSLSLFNPVIPAHELDECFDTCVTDSPLGKAYNSGITAGTIDKSRGNLLEQHPNGLFVIAQHPQHATAGGNNGGHFAIPIMPGFTVSPLPPGFGITGSRRLQAFGLFQERQNPLGDGNASLNERSHLLRLGQRGNDSSFDIGFLVFKEEIPFRQEQSGSQVSQQSATMTGASA